jgi:hypothetical protein
MKLGSETLSRNAGLKVALVEGVLVEDIIPTLHNWGSRIFAEHWLKRTMLHTCKAVDVDFLIEDVLE